MLLQFTVGNFRCFKEKATMSFIASNYDKTPNSENNIYVDEKFKLRILKTAVVYGANASGKSKLFESLAFMKDFILNSFSMHKSSDVIDVKPFAFDDVSANLPSFFDIVFLQNGKIFNYGFELNNEVVLSEWFFVKEHKKEIKLFSKQADSTFYFHPKLFKLGSSLKKNGLLRNNALVLSAVAASENKEELVKEFISWFSQLNVLNANDTFSFAESVLQLANSEEYKKKVLQFLQDADFGISNFEFIKSGKSDYSPEIFFGIRESLVQRIDSGENNKPTKLITTHKLFDQNKKGTSSVHLSLEDDESAGTKKFLALCGPILSALEGSSCLIVDELDSQLHVNLVQSIVRFFHSKTTNPKIAQLVFNTHNTKLLNAGLFRRDQIWFVEKNRYGASTLFSLSDIKERKDSDFETSYLLGKYGAVPYLGNLGF